MLLRVHQAAGLLSHREGETERIAQEVVPTRPSLWFHLDRALPEASDPGVPWIHYHPMVDPMSFFLPGF